MRDGQDGLTGLDGDGRAAALGMSYREFVALHGEDPRILDPAAVATDGSVTRLRRWHVAGRPVGELGDLVYVGDDCLHDLVIAVLERVPRPVRWHAVTGVSWFSVGRESGAWMARAPRLAVPDGDRAHMIVLGPITTEAIVAHELGHSWHATVSSDAPAAYPHISERELAHRLVQQPALASEMVRHRRRSETLADETATAWGFPIHGNAQSQVASLQRDLAAAAEEKRSAT